MFYFKKEDQTKYVQCVYLLTMVIGPSVETFITQETKLRREDVSTGVLSIPGHSLGAACAISCKWLNCWVYNSFYPGNKYCR